MVSFPLFCAWIHELQPGRTADEAQRETEARLNAVLANQLRRSGFWEKEDVTDCRNDVLMFMEKRLREPMEFAVNAELRAAAELLTGQAPEVKVMHLLRAEPFAIVACHPGLQPAREFRARLRDMADSSEVATISRVSCEQERRVPIRLAYDTLRHEQSALLELSQDGDFSVAYCSGVMAVRFESLEIRMRFVIATTRNLAREHARARRKGRASSLDDLPSMDIPAPGDEARQRMALLLAQRAMRSIPRTLREQMIEHYVDGRSWAEIAREREVAEVKLRKKVSRALTTIAGAMVAAEPEAAPGAVPRVIKWLKEMLPHILGRRSFHAD